MKEALSPLDVAGLAIQLESLKGAKLQEIHVQEKDIFLGFWTTTLVWVVVHLDAIRPNLYATKDPLPKTKSEKKPLGLFMNSHALGARLESVRWLPEYGRVLVFHLTNSAEIEVRLFPHGQNIMVRHEGKQVAWQKPAALTPLKEMPVLDLENLKGRPLFKKLEASKAAAAPIVFEEVKKRKIEKIKIAIQKISEDIKNKNAISFFKAAEWLKANQTLKVPPEFLDFISEQKSFSQNLEELYKKHKAQQLKIAGAQKRQKELQDELATWAAMTEVQFKSKTKKPPVARKRDAQYQGRTLELSDGLVVFVGRSGQDNLKILRQSQPWHFWLHLRDFPSAHAVLRRQKGQMVGDRELQLAAQFLLKCNFGAKAEKHKGDKFEVLCAECRFVRPIKGDKHGRVTYSDSRSFVTRFE